MRDGERATEKDSRRKIMLERVKICEREGQRDRKSGRWREREREEEGETASM